MSKIRDQRGEDLLLEMEANANAFNLKCLAVLCGLCNVIGIFIVEARTMRIAAGSSLLAFSLPILVWLIHD